MKLFAQFCTILLLISLSNAQSINDFFGDDVDAGLVSFDPINIDQSQGVFGNDDQLGEDSIGGIFANQDLSGGDTLAGFSVGGNIFAGGVGNNEEGDNNVAQIGGGVFAGGASDDVLSTVPLYAADGTSQVDQVQQNFQQNLLGLFN